MAFIVLSAYVNVGTGNFIELETMWSLRGRSSVSDLAGQRAVSCVCAYLFVGLHDGELLEPALVVQHAVLSGAHQLRAQHAPRQGQMKHCLHGNSPVLQRDPT